MRKLCCLLFIITCMLCGCDYAYKAAEEEPIFNENAELIFSSEISPNEEYIESEDDKVIYTVQIYQDTLGKITVYANSNSAFFEPMQYEVVQSEKISEDDVDVTWTTLMGNTEATEKDQLVVADVVITSDGEIFSERKVNFVKGVMEIITDVIDKERRNFK